jgi:hypothetical protein
MKHFIFLTILVLLAGCSGYGTGGYEETDSIDPEGTDSYVGDSDAGDSDAGDSDPWSVNCEEVACPDEPRPLGCNEEGQLVTYSGTPECVDGVCQYEESVEDCMYACAYDNDGLAYCKNMPCDRVVCDNPPDSQCTDLPISLEEACWGATGMEFGIHSPAIGAQPSGGYLMEFKPEGQCANSDTRGISSDGVCGFIPAGECHYNRASGASMVHRNFCGDVNGCIEVPDGDDYCDDTVHTPCQETGCWWLPTINDTSKYVCVGEDDGFDADTRLMYDGGQEGTCLPDGTCEYHYTTQICEFGCVNGTCAHN